MNSLLDINLDVTIIITFSVILFTGGISVGILIFKHPEKVEKWLALIHKLLRKVIKSAEKQYIKYDIQSRVNNNTARLAKLVPNLTQTNVKVVWINENQSKEEFILEDKVVIRMHKSTNQNKNVVHASLAFISAVLLKKAKNYIAKYQKNAINLFVGYKLFENEKREILDQFVQDFLIKGVEKDEVADFYDKFFDIDRAGIFFSVFLLEMTFLGEKVFGRGVNRAEIHQEVSNLVAFLFRYANRKVDEKGGSDFNGLYSKFAISIIGKRVVIDNVGERTYINYLKKISSDVETIYIIGNIAHKKFIKGVITKCKEAINFSEYLHREYSAIIKDKEGEDLKVDNCLVILRSDKIAMYHRT